MPFLDFSDVINDPDLADRVTVYRREQDISAHGRVVIHPRRFAGVVGVVTAASPNDLERLDDSQRMGRHLSFVTTFTLRGPAVGFQPDLVNWRGDAYVVKSFDPYPQFGAGFYQAILGSINIQDVPAPGKGQLNYSEAANAGLIPLGVTSLCA